MKILLTGASGFVGKHLLPRLLELGHFVVVPSRRKLEVTNPRLEVHVREELFDPVWLDELMIGVDVVVHAAALAHQTRDTTDEDRRQFERVNVGLSKILIKSAIKSEVEQFIFISSIVAIRGFSEHLVDERTLAAPSSDYAKSKFEAEKSLKELSASEETQLTILRPCLVYGKGNLGNMKRLSNLIDKKLPLPFGGVTSKRSFIYIENLVDAVVKSLQNSTVYNEHFILSDDELVSLPELIGEIAKAKNSTDRVVYCPLFILRILGYVGDFVEMLFSRSIGVDSYSIRKLTGSLPCTSLKFKTIVDWKPPFTFSQGVYKTFKEE